MNQHGICQYFALIAWITLALPVFGQEPCKGYTHSRDGEVEAVYNLIIENGIVECTPTKTSDYLECGSKGAVLWGDAISRILTASEPITGSLVILTDAKSRDTTTYSPAILNLVLPVFRVFREIAVLS